MSGTVYLGLILLSLAATPIEECTRDSAVSVIVSQRASSPVLCLPLAQLRIAAGRGLVDGTYPKIICTRVGP